MTPTRTHNWLVAHSIGLPRPDPIRTECLPEPLVPGDVTDEGDIVLADGAYLAAGRCWLPCGKEHNAAFYGWRRRPVAIECFNGGWFIQVERGDPNCPEVKTT